jgi:hypothetical protein
MAQTPLTLEGRASIRTANGGGASLPPLFFGTAVRLFRMRKRRELPETHTDVRNNRVAPRVRPTSISPAADTRWPLKDF